MSFDLKATEELEARAYENTKYFLGWFEDLVKKHANDPNARWSTTAALVQQICTQQNERELTFLFVKFLDFLLEENMIGPPRSIIVEG